MVKLSADDGLNDVLHLVIQCFDAGGSNIKYCLSIGVTPNQVVCNTLSILRSISRNYKLKAKGDLAFDPIILHD
jgi:hypothetical protein